MELKEIVAKWELAKLALNGREDKNKIVDFAGDYNDTLLLLASLAEQLLTDRIQDKKLNLAALAKAIDELKRK